LIFDISSHKKSGMLWCEPLSKYKRHKAQMEDAMLTEVGEAVVSAGGSGGGDGNTSSMEDAMLTQLGGRGRGQRRRQC
jgi:hypothetical protein